MTALLLAWNLLFVLIALAFRRELEEGR